MNAPTVFHQRTLWLFGAILASSVLAQPAVNVAVTGNQIAGTGSAVVSLQATGIENNVTFTLSWDPAILQYVSDAKGPTVVSYLPNRAQTANGKLSVLAAASPGATYQPGANPVVTVNFTAVAPSAGTVIALIDGTSLTPPLARKRVFDAQGNNLASAIFTNATIAVSPR